MAKITLKSLQEEYGFKSGDVKGLNYRTLMKKIIENQSLNISRATARISKSNYQKELKKITKKEKRLVLPNVEESIPKRSVFVRKAAQDGDIITDTLRDSLTKNLRDTLKEFKTKKTGEPAFIRRTGKQAGTINPKVIEMFESRIMNTFKNYTKRDPSLGVPKNIHGIAVTEMRSILNPVKHEYNKKLLSMNEGKMKMFKMWRQNKGLSAEPREGHSEVNGKKIEMHEKFQVPLIVKTSSGVRRKGFTFMEHPHDKNAPAEQVVNCNCEAEYFAVLI